MLSKPKLTKSHFFLKKMRFQYNLMVLNVASINEFSLSELMRVQRILIFYANGCIQGTKVIIINEYSSTSIDQFLNKREYLNKSNACQANEDRYKKSESSGISRPTSKYTWYQIRHQILIDAYHPIGWFIESFPINQAYYFSIIIFLKVLYFVYSYYIAMLKGVQKDNLQFIQKPRKLIKINVREDDNYNEFKGNFLEEKDEAITASMRQNKNEPEVQFSSIEEESNRNKNIFQLIKTNAANHQKIRTIGDASKPNKTPSNEVQKKSLPKKQTKIEQKSIQKPQIKSQPSLKKNPKPQKQANGLSNWQSFLTNASNTTKQNKNQSKKHEEFIAIDCEFVKSNQEQLLARISLVNENGQCKLDTYVHPDKKITDYVTDISGITYGHIKNAPNIKTVIENVKSILYNKIVIGHTVWKDLEVCGLKNWKGMKAIVDICEFTPYQQKSGKLISLKNLCARFLGKKIQEGHHSSTEDAHATMSLFLLRKKEILKHFKLIV